jgi:ATP-dependent DNA helicase RecG
MPDKMPIKLNDLLRQRTVESERIEYKAGWNPDPIIRTLCAFANDFENLGGGYVVIGQDCDVHGRRCFRRWVCLKTSSTKFSRHCWRPAS